MIEIARAFADHRYRRITFAMGTQMGKTATMFNIIGWKLDDQPEPIIYVGATQSNIDNVVEKNIVKMFRECPSLWAKMQHGKKSTKHNKQIAGTHLRLAWAGSASELASDSASLTFVDEVDRPEKNATGEGDLIELAEARGDAYPNSKLGITSTPTEGRVEAKAHTETGLEHWLVSDNIQSPVWQQWQEGTRKEWAIPCPDCNEYFIPKSHLLWYPEDATPTIARCEAKLACANCGTLIDDKYRNSMNALGVYVAPGEKVEDGKVVGQAETEGNSNASYWVSGLCSFSAKKSYGHIAEKLVKAIKSGDKDKLQTVYNTGFGEVYALAGDTPSHTAVYQQRGTHSTGEVPEDVYILLCTVDVQKDRFVYVVRGWKPDYTSWLIEAGEIWVDTDKPEAQRKLEQLLTREYNGHFIAQMGVDAGYRKDTVHQFVRAHGNAKALRGRPTLAKPFTATNVDVNHRGKVLKNGVKEWHLNADIGKSWVHGRIGWPMDESGAWFLPVDVTEDYCKQIVAEERRTDSRGRGVWKQIHRDNHFLDCEQMNYMLARIVAIQHMNQKPEIKKPTPEQTKPKPRERRKQNNEWLNKWK
jgi:phage terminase large subunit GpA-like protein